MVRNGTATLPMTAIRPRWSAPSVPATRFRYGSDGRSVRIIRTIVTSSASGTRMSTSSPTPLLIRLAVRASRINNGVGLLVLILVPLALLVTIVLMMRTLRPSLPYLNRVAGTDGADQRGLIAVIGSVAVPFLTIY